VLVVLASFLSVMGCDDDPIFHGSCRYAEDGVDFACADDWTESECTEEGADYSEQSCSARGFPQDCGDNVWIASGQNCADLY